MSIEASGVASSKEQLVAGKFVENFINKGKVADLVLLDTGENIEKIKEAISKYKGRLMSGDFSVDEVVAELKKSGIIKPSPILEKKKEEVKEVEIYKTEQIKVKGLTQVEIDENQIKILEANLLSDEVDKAKIFRNDEELVSIHEKALTLEKKRPLETLEYYHEFAKAGLIKSSGSKSPEDVVKEDMRLLEERKQDFKSKEPLDLKEKKKLMKAKQIATITECVLAYGVSESSWYGEKISIEPASEFDDIKRGVDEVMEIVKDGDESSFIGLGIDVTYRGLKSEQFKKKLFMLLQSIRDGHKTKVKYFKNHKGEMVKEFAVPKIILYFDLHDVKELVEVTKNIDDPKVKEGFKNSPQKYNVMNQIINSCNKLSAFAEESKNDIFRGYIDIVNSIKELSWENEEIKNMINVRHDDEISKHIDILIKEFKDIKKQEKMAKESELE